MEGKIKIGPVGKRNSNSQTTNWDEGHHNGIISQIFISHGSTGIFSIQFQFVFDEDKFVLSDLHGHNIGTKFDVVALDYPHEYITGISGGYKTGYGTPKIATLKLVTNSNEYGPFGSLDSSAYEPFSFNLGKYPQFGGFYGTYDDNRLNLIGVYLQPITVKHKIKPETSTIDAEEVESKQICLDIMLRKF